jgi:lysophospholipase L1-like esterase
MPPGADARWSPQLIVIGLGTNDFSTPIGAEEPWRNQAELAAAFEARYVDFVRALARRHPSARFVLITTDAGNGAADQAVRRVRSRLQTAGVPVADVLTLGPLKLNACNWHPTAEDHEVIARQLIGAIEALAPW